MTIRQVIIIFFKYKNKKKFYKNREAEKKNGHSN